MNLIKEPNLLNFTYAEIYEMSEPDFTYLWSKGRWAICKNDMSLSVKLIAPRKPPQSNAALPINLKIPPRCPNSASEATNLIPAIKCYSYVKKEKIFNVKM